VLAKVPQELKEPDIPWQVEFTFLQPFSNLSPTFLTARIHTAILSAKVADQRSRCWQEGGV
jgi:hypothetical protein